MRPVFFLICLALGLFAQTPPADAPAGTKGLPPRAAPTDYQFQERAGDLTIAAEFTGHSIPTAEGPLTTEDFVAVEAAIFGPADKRALISAAQFSLRINGKKTALPSQPFALLLSSLKDPEYIPPEVEEKKSKGGIMGGGGGGGGRQPGDPPPPPPKIPIEIQRAMAKRVQQSALPQGDRPLPVAGVVFFRNRGKTENLESVELLYEGPAGSAVLKLQ